MIFAEFIDVEEKCRKGCVELMRDSGREMPHPHESVHLFFLKPGLVSKDRLLREMLGHKNLIFLFSGELLLLGAQKLDAEEDIILVTEPSGVEFTKSGDFLFSDELDFDGPCFL